MPGAAAAICAALSTLIELCSMSMNSQSKPQVAAAEAMSTVRAWRRPRPSARRPSLSRCLARLAGTPLCYTKSLGRLRAPRRKGREGLQYLVDMRPNCTKNMAKQQVYDAAAIQALKGLEPVRRMPGMYTHTVHPLHVVQEAIDNAVDEALAGFGQKIRGA